MTLAASASLEFRGIHVVGQLVIDTRAATGHTPINIELTVEFVFVEGTFTILTAEDSVVPSPVSSVTITLVEPQDGRSDFTFESIKHPKKLSRAVGIKCFVVWGGLLDVRALPSSCVSWTRLKDVVAARTLVLEHPVGPCWAPGAELLVTSHTTLLEDAQTVTIESSDDDRVTLSADIIRPTTMVESEDFAVEVALLSRNVVIQGAVDQLDAMLIGGHLMVMETPGVPQLMHGVLLRKMGQQGLLGRYPMHMHMSHGVAGTVLSALVIRTSYQVQCPASDSLRAYHQARLDHCNRTSQFG